MPLNYILETKISMYGHPLYLNDETINGWSFWKFIMNIDIINSRNKKSEDVANTINSNSTYNLLNKK